VAEAAAVLLKSEALHQLLVALMAVMAATVQHLTLAVLVELAVQQEALVLLEQLAEAVAVVVVKMPQDLVLLVPVLLVVHRVLIKLIRHGMALLMQPLVLLGLMGQVVGVVEVLITLDQVVVALVLREVFMVVGVAVAVADNPFQVLEALVHKVLSWLHIQLLPTELFTGLVELVHGTIQTT
jgi:hypothetical protein